MVNTVEQAKAAVASVHYPPKGQRGVGLARAQGYGVDFDNYQRRAAEETVVIVQIESITALENLEAILAVDGVDGYIVGPYDFSASMNLAGQFENPKVKEALNKVQTLGAKSGKPGGTHLVEPDPVKLRQLIEQGHRFIAYGVDFRMLDVSARIGSAFSRTARSGVRS